MKLEYIISYLLLNNKALGLSLQPTRRTAQSQQPAFQEPATSLSVTRSAFLSCATTALLPATAVLAFEGGVGGLGKTKPETGVTILSEPLQNSAGLVSAEILVPPNIPVRVSFTAPWNLLPTTAGLEARDLQQPESAFVQVAAGESMPNTKSEALQVLLSSVLSQQGKFGAYSSPIDVKVKKINDTGLFNVNFTTFTPGMRESERQVLVQMNAVNRNNLVMLVVGTTRQRFPDKLPVFQKIVDSFEVLPGPATRLR